MKIRELNPGEGFDLSVRLLEFWFNLTSRKNISPNELLVDDSDVDKVVDAIDVITKFREYLEEAIKLDYIKREYK